MNMNSANAFICCCDISAVDLPKCAVFLKYLQVFRQCLACHDLHFSAHKVCTRSYLAFILILLKPQRSIDMDL